MNKEQIKEKMRTGKLYSCDNEEIACEQAVGLELQYDYNMTRPCEGKKRQELLASFQRAETLWKTKAPGFFLQCRAELYHILYLLRQSYQTAYVPERKQELIAPAVEQIHKRYTEELLSVSELSALCRITPEYFRKIFRDCYGSTPIQYINRLKLARAKELLKSGYTVGDAAELSGFSDMSHFSREFKKNIGIAPSVYQKSAKSI